MKIIVPDYVLVRDLEGEAVLLNLDSEQYFGLDEIGARMWEILTNTPSIEVAFDTLLGEFDVEAEMLRSDMDSLIEQLVNHQLILLQDD